MEAGRRFWAPKPGGTTTSASFATNFLRAAWREATGFPGMRGHAALSLSSAAGIASRAGVFADLAGLRTGQGRSSLCRLQSCDAGRLLCADARLRSRSEEHTSEL